jgi:hypothetical protein
MSHNCSEAIEDEIKVCAYFIWEQEGKPVGRALDHWLQAELQLAASLWHDSLLYQEGRTSAASPWPLQFAGETDTFIELIRRGTPL